MQTPKLVSRMFYYKQLQSVVFQHINDVDYIDKHYAFAHNHQNETK